LIRFIAAPFRHRKSPETGPDTTRLGKYALALAMDSR
jgi:hypothetical protein